jgi:uncharacterized protein (DUF1697 family)
MPRYVAFLRAINVGGHVVKMDRLRALIEELGVTNVETFIASGNVLFDSPSKSAAALEQKIERRLEAALGYAVTTFVRPLAEIAAVATSHPFDGFEANGHTLSVGFLKSALGAEQRRALALHATSEDEFHAQEREVYWLCRGRTSDSQVSGKALEKTLGPATFRNVTTVRKIAAKAPQRPS